MENSQKVAVTTLSRPEGGGVINVMGDALSMPGLMVRYFSLPLPVSAGRGFVTSLSLNYSSSAVNGPFGIGWQRFLSYVFSP